MRALIVVGLLLTFPHAALAEGMCDFEHHCYGDGDPQVTAGFHKPQPRYVPPTRKSDTVCHLVYVRESPMLPQRVVEMCTMTQQREDAIRSRMVGGLQ